MTTRIPLLLTVMVPSILSAPASHAQARAPFEPPAGKRLLIIGQDLGAIGGMDRAHNDGYADHIPIPPGGVTTYTDLHRLLGLTSTVDLGAGQLNAQQLVDSSSFRNSVLVIGLYMVGQEKAIGNGRLDASITTLANWVKNTRRPVFLRIGYEFDGHWNNYDPANYQLAWRRIVDRFRALGVTNFATVWQSCTSPYNDRGGRELSAWYPGDEYVDWMGYSWFLSGSTQQDLTNELLEFARSRGKPVMVCESAPQGYDLLNLTKGSPTGAVKDKVSTTPQQIWTEWFVPFFDFIDTNSDVIKAVAYINTNWDAQAMWGPPYHNGYWGDTRVQVNNTITENWLRVIGAEEWLVPGPSLFKQLQPHQAKHER